MAFYGPETWTLWAADQKYLESFDMWPWRMMGGMKKCYLASMSRGIHEIRKWKAKWIVHILHRKCLLKQVIEGKIKGEMEVTRRRGRRRKKLLEELKDRRGYSHLKEEALDV